MVFASDRSLKHLLSHTFCSASNVSLVRSKQVCLENGFVEKRLGCDFLGRLACKVSWSGAKGPCNVNRPAPLRDEFRWGCEGPGEGVARRFAGGCG